MGSSLFLIITGNVSTEPRQTQIGDKNVTNFNIAVNRTRNGERQKLFIRCGAWGATGDVVASWVHKGDPIQVMTKWIEGTIYEGQIQYNCYADQVTLLSRREPVLDDQDAQEPQTIRDAIPF